MPAHKTIEILIYSDSGERSSAPGYNKHLGPWLSAVLLDKFGSFYCIYFAFTLLRKVYTVCVMFFFR